MFTPSVYSTSSTSSRSHLSLYSSSSHVSSSAIFSNTCFIDPNSGFMNSTKNGSFNTQNNYYEKGFQQDMDNFSYLFTNGCNISNNNKNNSVPNYFKMNQYQINAMPFFENYTDYDHLNVNNNQMKTFTNKPSKHTATAHQVYGNKLTNQKENSQISKQSEPQPSSSNKHDTNEDYIKKLWSSVDIDKFEQKNGGVYSDEATKVNTVRLPRPIVKSKFQPIISNSAGENKSKQILISDPNIGCLRPKSANKVVQSYKSKTRTSTSSLSSVSSSDSTNSSSTWRSSSKKSSTSSSPSSTTRDRQLPLRSRNVDLSKYLNNGLTSSVLISANCNNTNNNNDQASCSFCKNNGEKEGIYMSHPLKDSLGKVVCPILREYVCPKCGESGDYAHTNKYCPETQRKHKESKIKRCYNQLD